MKTILQIDGGGIKGVLPATILTAVERDLGKPIHQIFDLITGTSTGAIIGGCLAAGVSAEQIRTVYVDHGRELFTPLPWYKRVFGAPRYDRIPFQGALLQYIGEKKMIDCRTPLMVTAYGLCANRTHFLKSWDEVDNEHKLIDTISWSALSAAYYFGKISAPDYHWSYLDPDNDWSVKCGEVFQDGGQGAFNNTISFAMTEMLAQSISTDKDDRYFLLSLGCGDSIDIDRYDHEKTLGKWQQVRDYVLGSQARRESTIQQVMSANYVMEKNPHKLLFCRLNCSLPVEADELDAVKHIPLFQQKASDILDDGLYQSVVRILKANNERIKLVKPNN